MNEPTKRRRSVLVVEDDDAIARMLARYLSVHYDVRVANDGASGLREIQASRPDVVVCDVTLPVIDGHEMVRVMRAGPGSHPPVIFLTARGRSIDVIEGIRAGARHYLTKPVDLADLLAKVTGAMAAGAH